MLLKNRLVLIVLTVASSVCVLNTATHSACDSFDECERGRAQGWICVYDNNNREGQCYKAIPPHARSCEERRDGSEWHYDEQRCYTPSGRTGPLAPPPPSVPSTPTPPSNPQNPVSNPQNPPSDALSSPEANTLATVLRETIDRILLEDAIEPNGAPDQQGISEKPQSNQPLTENPELAPDEDTAKPEDIFITEIMVDTLGDTLPQWIELTNYSTKEVNLKGWRMRIVNKFDDSAYPKVKEISLNNIVLGSNTSEEEDDKSPVALITYRLWGRKGRKSANLNMNNVLSYDLYRGYNILSKVEFRIELIPPPNTDRSKADVAGNLPRRNLFLNVWKLPEQSKERRSSLIRRKNEGWMQSKGISIDAWILAHNTELANQNPSNAWYGKDDDIGSPGRVDEPMMINEPEVPAAPKLIRKLKFATSWASLKKESR
ncbi:MAG: lamin tail domain-containing protein [Candidatus Poribacteria bacterium]|nr:lamin tail domain-containing protein [Candidatus Poribacteria bacterium]